MLTGELTPKTGLNWRLPGPESPSPSTTPEKQASKPNDQAVLRLLQSQQSSMNVFPDKATRLDFQEAISHLNFLKTQPRLGLEQTTRVSPQFFPSRNSTSRESKPIAAFCRAQHRVKEEVYRSHEKVPPKMKAPREILKEANLRPIKLDQSHLSEKIKVIYNLIAKQDRYFYCNRTDIRSIVRGIYYQGQTVESLEEFKLPAFKRVNKPQEYFDQVWEEGLAFAEAVSKVAKGKINKLINKKEGKQTAAEAALPFLHFLKAPQKYKRTVDQLFGLFKHVEHISLEVEKLTSYFVEFFREKSSFDCEGFKFHLKLIASIYRDPQIQRFFDQQMRTFQKHQFYEAKYPDVFEKIYEIHEITKKRIEEANAASSNDDLRHRLEAGQSRKDLKETAQSIQTSTPVTEDFHHAAPAATKQRINSRETTEIWSKACQSNIEDKSQTLEAKSEAVSKKKRKRNKKKKTAAEDSGAAVEENPPEGVPGEESGKEIESLNGLNQRLAEIEGKYQLETSRRLRISFTIGQLEELAQLSKEK
jgi:hypothetical protein